MSESAVRAGRPAVVVTSIAAPNSVLKKIAADSIAMELDFFVIGDTKSPADFSLDGCQYFSVDQQRKLDSAFAQICPVRHYARKNIGYLLAIQAAAPYIIETDDDNLPGSDFYKPLPQDQNIPVLREIGWVNVYRYYTDALIWPRGLPLDAVKDSLPALPAPSSVRCPIQQGLADDNPDVDAIYRLLLPLPVRFDHQHRIALGENAWCPFNSQNTIFYPDAYPLLYLPAYCSFRMTDIWRSFIAQRIAWANSWAILFREATVEQFRNDHSLMKDFEDEIPGYLNNRRIIETLKQLPLEPGVSHIPANMRKCYDALIEMGVVRAEERPLLDAWLQDLSKLI
jgi:hypothetical protein